MLVVRRIKVGKTTYTFTIKYNVKINVKELMLTLTRKKVQISELTYRGKHFTNEFRTGKKR